MARQFVNQASADVIKAKIAQLGGEVSYVALRDALVADGNGDAVRDITNLHIGGVIPGIVRAQPEGKPVLFLLSKPHQPAESASGAGAVTTAPSSPVPTQPSGNT